MLIISATPQTFVYLSKGNWELVSTRHLVPALLNYYPLKIKTFPKVPHNKMMIPTFR